MPLTWLFGGAVGFAVLAIAPGGWAAERAGLSNAHPTGTSPVGGKKDSPVAAEQEHTPRPLRAVFGVGFALTRSSAVRGIGVTATFLSHHTAKLTTGGAWQQHSNVSAAIGGGGNGFEGTLTNHLAWGIDLADGPLLLAPRFGATLAYLGNKHFVHEFMGLPMLEFGFGYEGKGVRLEMGPYSGLGLLPRLKVDGKAADTHGAAVFFGGYGLAAFRGFQLSLDAFRIVPTKADLGRPIDRVDGNICVAAKFAALCAQGRLLRGESNGDSGFRRIVAYQAGGLIGVRLGK